MMGADLYSRRLSGFSVAVVGICVVVFFALMPAWAGRGILALATEILVVFTMAQMWNLLAGYAGLVSIGHQAFVGLGGYFLYGFADWSGVNAYLVLPLAGLWCAVVAAGITPLLFRLKEVYFSIGMWVFAELMRLFHSKIEFLGANHGLPFRAARQLDRDWFASITFWIAAVLAVGSFTLIFLLMRTRFGLGLTAVRDNDLGAENLGVNVRFNRFVAFVISAFGCGCAGALFYMNAFFMDPVSAFNIHWAAAMIFIVIIGGIGTLEGPIIGAVIYYAIREAFPGGGNWYLIVVGLVSVVVMLKAPRGVWGFLQSRYGVQIFPVQRLTPPEFSASVIPEALTSWTGWMTDYFDQQEIPATPQVAPARTASPGGDPEVPVGWVGWMADYFGDRPGATPPPSSPGSGGSEAPLSWIGWMGDYFEKPKVAETAAAPPGSGEPEVPVGWVGWMADYFDQQNPRGAAPSAAAPPAGGDPEVPVGWVGWMADYFDQQAASGPPAVQAAAAEPEVPVSWTGWMAEYFEQERDSGPKDKG